MKRFKLLAACVALIFNTACTYIVTNDDGKHKPNKEQTFSFALIGDTPYGVLPGVTYSPFDHMQKEINSDRSVLWVLHAGDIKSGSTPCSDQLFLDRRNRYKQFNKPVILTLGDNEWTDCHRVKAGGYQPLERLEKLREVFFTPPGTTLAKKMAVKSQAMDDGFEEFPENVMWSKGNVVFSAIHIVGSDNGLKPFDPHSNAVRTDEDDQEVERRSNAAIKWLNKAFDNAEEKDAAGVFIMIHANPYLEFKWLLPRDSNGVVTRPGFTEFLTVLATRTKAYGKPVVLAHGDSHWFRIDKPELPMTKDTADVFLDNFTRVETFGANIVHWIKVTVNPASDEVFTFSQQLVKENM